MAMENELRQSLEYTFIFLKALVAIFLVKFPNDSSTHPSLIVSFLIITLVLGIVLSLEERTGDGVPVPTPPADERLYHWLKRRWACLFPYYPNPENPNELVFYRRSVKHFVTPFALLIPVILAIIFSSCKSLTKDEKTKEICSFILVVVSNVGLMSTGMAQRFGDPTPRRVEVVAGNLQQVIAPPPEVAPMPMRWH